MTRRPVWILLAAAAGAACSPSVSDDTDQGGGDTSTTCTSNEQCDDALECTVDTCGADRRCNHVPVDALCGDGERCIPGRGCVLGACTIDEDCADDWECTVDTCGVGSTCQHTAVDGLCPDRQLCDPAAGCVDSGECTTAADCDDTVACTIDECVVGNVCEHAATDALCDDGQRCNPTSGCFTPVPCTTADECPIGNWCDGAPRCEPEFGCIPPAMPRNCDDSDPCTDDLCDESLDRCSWTPNCSPGCLEGRPECLWSGCFGLDRTISQHCAMGSVNYDIDRICFELISTPGGTALNVTCDGSTFVLSMLPPGPTGTEFDAEFAIRGGCDEIYRMTGSFTEVGGVVDLDSLDLVWTAQYVATSPGGCFGAGCANQSIPVHGTRE